MKKDSSNSNDFIKYSNYAFFLIFIVSIIFLTIYRLQLPDQILNNKKSIDRINTINNVLNSLLGNNWRIVIIISIIFLIIILYLLYLYTQKGIIIDMNDQQYSKISWFIIIFLILYTIFIITLIVKILQTNKLNKMLDANNQNISDFIPAEIDQEKNKQIIEIIGLLLFIFSSIGIGIYYFYKKSKK
jgi:hypothetical protein